MTASMTIRSMLTKKSFTLVLASLLLSGLTNNAVAQSQPGDQFAAGSAAASAAAATRMIVSGTQEEILRLAERHGLKVAQTLNQGGALEGTPEQLEALSRDSAIGHISPDAIVESSMAVETTSIGADQVWEGTGSFGRITGQGIGVAIIDSGISNHPELGNRVVASVDLVDPNRGGEDGYGHGTHVAGLVAGVAPDAHLLNVRVLNDEGWGHASVVIAGIDYVVEHMNEYSIRVVNLSLGAGVGESYRTDPLGQAVERAVAAGLVVVASAGNFGKTEEGTPVIGGVTSPGNTPSALTVGAINTFDTAIRSDDEVTSYSSRGPTAYDYVLEARHGCARKQGHLAAGCRLLPLNELPRAPSRRRIHPAQRNQHVDGLRFWRRRARARRESFSHAAAGQGGSSIDGLPHRGFGNRRVRCRQPERRLCDVYGPDGAERGRARRDD